MHINCPHCQSPIEIVGEQQLEVVCPSCGSSIMLDPGKTRTFLPTNAPRRLGKYELLEQLGVGAFGTVCKARDTELDRIVAIKIPRAGNLSSQEDVDRFLREARSAAQLRHPGIVSVFDASQSDGTCFLVSEYVQGATLSDRLGAGRLTFRRAAELIAEVADAIHVAHQHGVIHRDIKPSNIMIDLDGRPHVMDFGLAKRDAGEITMTLDGQVLGTPAYMPPEQARGEGHDVDARGDVYSLGVILYELLTGELPFRGNSRMLIVQVIQDEPRPLRRINDKIPRDLETICLKTMAKHPSKRYASAHELADDLRRFLSGELILARPVSEVERFWRWYRRNTLVAGLLATVATALLVGTVASSYFAIEANLRANAEGAARVAEAEAKALAQRNADRADREAKIACQRLYIAHMNQAQLAWEKDRVGQVRELLDEHGADSTSAYLRGFEWYYWDRQCHLDLRTIKVGALATLSADWTRVASVTDTLNRIKITDIVNGQEIVEFKGNTNLTRVSHLAISPDGRRIALCSLSNWTVTVWDATAGQMILTLTGHAGPIKDIVFSSDGLHIASASEDKTIRIWDAVTGRESMALRVGNYLHGIAFSPDGKRLAICEVPAKVRKLDGTDTSITLQTQHPVGPPSICVAFSPDGTRVATGSLDASTAKVYEATTGHEIITLEGHAGPVQTVAFSPDGKRIATGSLDQTTKVWDATTGQELFSRKGHAGGVVSVGFSSDGSTIATTGGDGELKIWDATKDESCQLKLPDQIVRTAVFAADGTLFAASYMPAILDPGTLSVLDAATGVEIVKFQGLLGQIRPGNVALSSNARMIACRDDQMFRVWEVASGRETITINEPSHGREWVAISPDATRVALAGGPIKIWKLKSGEKEVITADQSNGHGPIIFSHDGSHIVQHANDVPYGTVKVWDAATGHLVDSFQGHNANVSDLALSPDGSLLALASVDETVRLWDAATGREVHKLKGHAGPVRAVAFSHDGARVVSGSEDKTLMIWDATTGLDILTLKGHSSGVRSIALDQSGLRIVSCDNHSVIVWDARPRVPGGR